MLTHWFTDVEKKLQGWPNGALTLALLSAAVILVLIALRASPAVKAGALVYVWLP